MYQEGLNRDRVIDYAAENGDRYGNKTIPWTIWPPICAVALYLLFAIGGSGMFRSDEYARMMGTVETRTWSQDVQPKDPAHMRMATSENAFYQAQKVLGQAGAIGSQFEISADNMTLQMIHNELWYVVPLDFSGFSVWSNSSGVPGYIKIHGEDPHRQPELVMLPDGKKMRYTPGAYFGDNLERHLRNNGYLNSGLSDWTFEVDEGGREWWVVTVYEPTIMWWGQKVTGVVLVDPTSGEREFCPMGKIPEWVDRAVPSWVIKDYLSWQGEYVSGWKNSWWGKVGLTKPESINLIYGAGNQPEWVTGITSKSDRDDSLVALVYTNSRTGKSVRYVMKGGATDAAIIDAVNKNQQVQFRHLHAVAPQLYNVYGVPVSVTPLLNESHAFQGVAMVPIHDIQTVAYGQTQYEALRALEKALSEGGQRVAVDKERNLKVVEGVLDRFSIEVLASGSMYYGHIPGIPRLFTAGAGESAKLPVTRAGDKVRIEFYESDRDVVPMHTFDNLSLELSASKAQTQVRAKAAERQDVEETQSDAQTVMERVKGADPKALQKLKDTIPPAKQ